MQTKHQLGVLKVLLYCHKKNMTKCWWVGYIAVTYSTINTISRNQTRRHIWGAILVSSYLTFDDIESYAILTDL